MRSRRGANALEFALLMPVLVAVFTGIMDYSFAMALREAAMKSARAGARAGATCPQSQDPDDAAAEAAADQWASIGLGRVPTIVAFRTGTPPRMTVRVTVEEVPLVGLVSTPSMLEATAVEQLSELP